MKGKIMPNKQKETTTELIARWNKNISEGHKLVLQVLSTDRYGQPIDPKKLRSKGRYMRIVKLFMRLNADHFKFKDDEWDKIVDNLVKGIGYSIVDMTFTRAFEIYQHWFMRCPPDAIIDRKLEKKIQRMWDRDVGIGTVRFFKYKKGEKIERDAVYVNGKKVAELRDRIRPIDSWRDYVGGSGEIYQKRKNRKQRVLA